MIASCCFGDLDCEGVDEVLIVPEWYIRLLRAFRTFTLKLVRVEKVSQDAEDEGKKIGAILANGADDHFVEDVSGDEPDDDESSPPSDGGEGFETPNSEKIGVFARRYTFRSNPKGRAFLTVNTKELVDQGKMNADCSDIRFTSVTTGANIPYYISPVPGCNAVETTIWLNPWEKQIDMTYGTPAKWPAFRPYKEPEVTTQSTKETLSLVQKLKKIDAKMYGAFWSPSSIDQLRAFGKEAMKGFPYVECFPAGCKKGRKMNQACETALKGAVKGYSMMPTWIIKGEKLVGYQDLQDLEAIADKYLAERN